MPRYFSSVTFISLYLFMTVKKDWIDLGEAVVYWLNRYNEVNKVM